eukprot:CAMPEP_0181195562 /NCGR_PEP_ID=MMETSP1096-20121128/14959_1 /TAXON_ID=156174 ORGANISM="Chrysochromulina ericina, Strain CCMP281" /NCGR_SAMPLE_ID=MMETSP1096 /ASSEMBLY_ACC=CAM_ASM_000453 /LENGTH=94 /DNA_ID=CAMNT_0023285185 /DNA_START=65 /DNA_END=349 /DNA_ORIENTATION=+
MTGLMRRSGSHTPAGNFSPKRGNKNFYKGTGGKKYGKVGIGGRFKLWGRGPVWYMPDLSSFRLKPYVAAGEGMERSKRFKKVNAADLSDGSIPP